MNVCVLLLPIIKLDEFNIIINCIWINIDQRREERRRGCGSYKAILVCLTSLMQQVCV